MTPLSLSQMTRIWARIGLLSFGGPAAQIALMHREIVEKHQLLSESQMLNALNFCMLLPGPEAMQLATYAGWRTHGTMGGLIAGLLFVLPGAFVIAALAAIYAAFGQIPFVEALFLGIKATVLVIVIEALIKVSKKALTQPLAYAIALAAFIGIFALQIPFPLIILAAALIGALFLKGADAAAVTTPKPALPQTLKTIALWAVIWALPFGILALVNAPLLSEIATFFSKLAIVTFGGAYAVLAYMAQDVVTEFGWLTTGEMMDGLGLAETTPGPLILVTEFVGFLAGFKAGGWGLALTAAALTLWVTFAPCFLWIFAGAPYIEHISSAPRLQAALSAITAAVVGVILNLSVFFALHVLFSEVTRKSIGPLTLDWPNLTTLNPLVLILSTLAGLLLLWRKWPLFWVLGTSALLALAAQSIGLPFTLS